MLISYSVKNFRSIKEKASVSFLGGAMKDSLKFPAYFESGNEKILKGIGVFGGNATGKSNLTDSLIALRKSVVDSANFAGSGKHAWIVPYLFSKDTRDAPSEFEIAFDYKGRRYFYQLCLTKGEIVYEALDVKDERRRSVFERKGGEARFAKDPGKVLKSLFEAYSLPNKPYVTLAAQFNIDLVEDVYYFFHDEISFVSGADIPDFSKVGKRLYEEKEYKEFLVSLLKASDVGIEDVSVQKSKGLAPLPPEERPSSASAGTVPLGERDYYRITTFHGGDDGKVEMDVSDESLGTQKVMGFSDPLFSTLRKGSILVVDEFGSSLFHELSSFLLSLFFDSWANERKAQIFFNSQDALLLEDSILRRDEVYMTEYGGEGKGSFLVPLSHYSVRKKEDAMHGFLHGRYVYPPIINPTVLRL